MTRRRILLCALGSLVALLVAGELFARFGLGLGDPPLSVADPEIEYLFAPSRTYSRFGNRVSFNRYSMRGTPDFPTAKTDPREFRVLMLGDSVINGGAQTDDADLASTILAGMLAERLSRPVIVANASAGSWGPPNLLAYTERFGFFDADVVVIVSHAGEYADIPTFSPLVGVSPAFPDEPPMLALTEAVGRYALPRLRRSAVSPAPDVDLGELHAEAMDAMRQLISRAPEGAAVVVAMHPTRDEARNGAWSDEAAAVAAVAHDAGAEVIDLLDGFAAAIEPHRDDIHPNETGQRLIAESLLPHLLAVAGDEHQASTAPAVHAEALRLRAVP